MSKFEKGNYTDSLQKTIVEIQEKFQPTEAEKRGFDSWLSSLNGKRSFFVSSIGQIVDILPDYPNYLDKEIALFFKKESGESFSKQELHNLMLKFAKGSPSYEINVFLMQDGSVYIPIGNKLSNNFNFEAVVDVVLWEFGHYHPMHFLSDAINGLNKPTNALQAGILPSPGDIKHYFKHPEFVSNNGTRIYSRSAYSELFVKSSMWHNSEQYIKWYFEKVVNMLMRKSLNSLDITDSQLLKMFDSMGFEIRFYYFDSN